MLFQVFIKFTFNLFDLNLPLLEPEVNKAATVLLMSDLLVRLVFSSMVPIHGIYDVISPEAFLKLWITHHLFPILHAKGGLGMCQYCCLNACWLHKCGCAGEADTAQNQSGAFGSQHQNCCSKQVCPSTPSLQPKKRIGRNKSSS